MKRNQMSTHSKEAFDESDAVDIVKRTLQSKHTIRAFFGENDKTPNHDGFFELINDDGTPYKKFVVQIKKTKPLREKTRGENKGKYVYQLKTNFLDYIKYKVTESPAIYFVVDVENKIILWLYLSDEVLMNLDYEGKPKVSYAFSEENILSDVSKFTSELNHIVHERNKAFLYKTESEISEMQDALDYINHHLDYDFKVIKETVFPNLWRFGIRCSDNPEISIGFGQSKDRIPVRSAVALYPQMKGKNDSGIQEYVTDYENLFNKFSLGEKEDLAIYSQNTLHKIIKLFFEVGIPPHYLPDLVLSELVDVFVQKSNSLWKAEIKLSLDEITRRYAVLIQYINHIILEDTIDDAENEFRQVLRSQLNTGRFHFLDIIQAISAHGLRSNFIEYQKNTPDSIALELKPQIAVIVASDYILFYKVLIELKERGVSSVDCVWDYDWNQIIGMNRNEQHNIIEILMKQWLGSLSELYKDTCTRLSLNLDYRLRHRYAFNILSNDFKASYIYKKYRDDKLSFIFDRSIDEGSIIFGSVEEGLISRTQSAELEKIFQHNTPLYNGLCDLLYKGICEKMGYKAQRIKIWNASYLSCSIF